MSPRLLRMALVGLVVAVVLMAGCGGGEAEGGNGTRGHGAEAFPSPPTQLDYVGKVDLVCARGSRRIGAALRRDRVAAAVSVPDMLREQVAKIRRLKGPREREVRLIPILEAMERGASEIETHTRLAFSGHTALDEAVQLSRENGFLECGLLK